jgi:hypothetical protein
MTPAPPAAAAAASAEHPLDRRRRRLPLGASGIDRFEAMAKTRRAGERRVEVHRRGGRLALPAGCGIGNPRRGTLRRLGAGGPCEMSSHGVPAMLEVPGPAG